MYKIMKSMLSLICISFILSSCTDGGSVTKGNENTANAESTEQSPQVEASDTRIQEAMQTAAQYIKKQYTIAGKYTDQDYDAQLTIIKQQLKPLLSTGYYTRAVENNRIALPLQIAIREQDSLTPKDITIRSRTLSGDEQLIHLSYHFHLQLKEHNESPLLGGKLVMQKEDGTWRVASDRSNVQRLLEEHK